MKRCTKCGEEGDLEEFGKDKRATDGRKSQCLACQRADDKRYRSTDAGRRRATERMARWRKANPERARATSLRHYHANRAKMLVLMTRYRNANKERMSELDRAWREKNRHVKAEIQRQRLARQRGAFVAEVIEDEIIRRDLGRCGICGKAIMGPLHLDHINPLAAGGTHEPDNIQIAHPACNIRKGARINFTLAA